MEKQTHYIIGIDLGTTNSAVAFKDVEDNAAEKLIEFLPIPQVVKAGEVEERLLLPSFLYLPGKHELPKGSLELPWDKEISYCVGEFARRQGSKVPNRLVHSAKSWLCHRGVDRKSPFLPFQATDEDLEKISPVEATTRYLLHMKNAWNYKIGKTPETAFENQTIYLAVPASFDAVARELTVLAAQNAGFSVTLLEEPQAAFYAWISNNEKKWRKILDINDLILVIDVGGGTTDLSLVSVANEKGNLTLRREAVGDHILLGGDNMDLALAHTLASQIPNVKLDIWQSTALWYTCREAKEKMCENESLAETTVSILGRGSSVIGGTIKTKLSRELLEKTLVEGFFPVIEIEDYVVKQRKLGLTQMNLPYAADPAITRHVASFLHQNRKDDRLPLSTPTAILFNGGVFKAKRFREQTVTVLDSWLKKMGKSPLKFLQSENLDLAVAKGAAYYGEVKRGNGIRIRGGTSRSYYLGIAGLMPAVPGFAPPLKALCVVPYGMEEGTEMDVPETRLGLVIGEPVEFPFFSSNQRKKDTIGQFLDGIEDLEQNARMENTLKEAGDIREGDAIPVKLHTKVTEIGTLEISCRSLDEKHQWNLEFNIRENQEK